MASWLFNASNVDIVCVCVCLRRLRTLVPDIFCRSRQPRLWNDALAAVPQHFGRCRARRRKRQDPPLRRVGSFRGQQVQGLPRAVSAPSFSTSDVARRLKVIADYVQALKSYNLSWGVWECSKPGAGSADYEVRLQLAPRPASTTTLTLPGIDRSGRTSRRGQFWLRDRPRVTLDSLFRLHVLGV